MKHIPMQELIEFGVRFMTKRGVPEDNALYLSQIVVESEAFHQSTHGIAQYKFMSDQLGKRIDPQAEPTIIRDQGAMALLEGERCFGHLVMKLAKKLAMQKAREYGVGFVAVRNTHWLGALGMHLISIAQAGMLAQAWAQTNTCKDCAPYGGIDARFSTNPISIVFPTEENPVLADFSSATMSMSAANDLIHQGKRTDKLRFIDNAGNPSNDPSVVQDGGTLMFAGGDLEGYKFYALSLFNEALTALAGGNANNPETPTQQSFSLLVLDPGAFAGSDYFLSEMKRFIEYMKSSRVRAGFEVRLPGERGFAALEDCRKNGVPLNEAKLRLLKRIAEDSGMKPIS